MPPEDKPPSPERAQTDESLRAERERTDDALAEDVGAVDEVADSVVEKARARADSVLAAARARTDRQPSANESQTPELVRRERAMEDWALERERAAADETLREERAKHVALLSIERDETDKDLFSERARSDHAVATREAFMGIVSHDLRNMLNTIMGFAGLIAERVKQSNHVDDIALHAKRIQRAGGRMNRLVGDLVDVASIEAGALVVTREVGDPAQIVTEAIDSFQAQATANGISLCTDVVPGAFQVGFDPARILQVLVNLIGNAIKFTPANGSVTVSVEWSGDEIRFAVRDTGQGIPEGQLQAVFERFLQVEKNDRRGVGLGLYISKCIVQGHGGRIWVESRIGEGSKFCFTIPLSTNELQDSGRGTLTR
ncbi:MAG TPA: HAMP domain-containing sensor histidine kinase [Polyangiaceae bacterium]|nr:HAMP domain-containing sensor histidine kinase [Polyangiaceae bacterium]